MKTDKKIVVTTLAALCRIAKAKGVQMVAKGCYMLKVDGNKLSIEETTVEHKQTALTVTELCNLAVASKVKPRVSSDGEKFLTIVIDPASNAAWVETSTAEEERIERALR